MIVFKWFINRFTMIVCIANDLSQARDVIKMSDELTDGEKEYAHFHDPDETEPTPTAWSGDYA